MEPVIRYQLTSPMHLTLGPDEIQRRLAVLKTLAGPGIQLEAKALTGGPGAIESARDAALVVPELLIRGQEAQEQGVAALIVGCFSDPGLGPLREVLDIPVVGPGSSAMHLAAQLGGRFAVLSPRQPGSRAVLQARGLGLEGCYAGSYGVDIPVLAFGRDPAATLGHLAERGQAVLATSGADTLVLGCMSMAFSGAAEILSEDLQVPVVNPVAAAVHQARGLVAMKLSHSRRAYPAPPGQTVY
ncbi:MAG: aspartate/glutamate racemase family protein [Candidatus Competibacterales bacterium]